jgi:hypothetical protein
MNTKKVLALFSAALFVAAFVLFAPDAASGQGRYANRYSRADVSGIISRMETSSNEFRRDFDRAMDNSNLNGSVSEQRFNNIVRDFENAVDRLRRQFDRNDSWWESRNEVQNMLRDARPVNTMMTTLAFRRNIERQWNRLRNDINTVADTYDLPGLNGGGWTGGGNFPGGNFPGGGGRGVNPPNWAEGTFYGRAPYGGEITLTISRNGSVTVSVNGEMSYGTYRQGNTLYMNGQTSRVSRQGNGILTVNPATGERISYTRSGVGGGGGYPGSGDQVRPPTWARGTFYGTAPNGARITLTIANNGRVTAVIDGQASYGSYSEGDVLTMDGATARVTSTNRGIRTVRTDNGEVINYRRQ